MTDATTPPADLSEIRKAFEVWAKDNVYPIDYQPDAECGVEGGPVYRDSRTHAAWWAYRGALEDLKKLTDGQIARAVRSLYTNDATAEMGRPEDIQTVRVFLASLPAAAVLTNEHSRDAAAPQPPAPSEQRKPDAATVDRVMDQRAHWRTAIVMMRDYGQRLYGLDGDADRINWEQVRRDFELTLDELAGIHSTGGDHG